MLTLALLTFNCAKIVTLHIVLPLQSYVNLSMQYMTLSIVQCSSQIATAKCFKSNNIIIAIIMQFQEAPARMLHSVLQE